MAARGQTLVILLPEPTVVHVGTNGWQEVHDLPTTAGAVDVHRVEIELGAVADLRSVEFTWRSIDGEWHGRDYVLAVADSPAG